MTANATAMFEEVLFKDIELLEKTQGTVIPASAIAAYPNTTLALVVCHPSQNRCLTLRCAMAWQR